MTDVVAGALRATPVFDGHNDLPMALRRRAGGSVEGLDGNRPELHTDLPRLRADGVGAQFWSRGRTPGGGAAPADRPLNTPAPPYGRQSPRMTGDSTPLPGPRPVTLDMIGGGRPRVKRFVPYGWRP
ncbi:membrane dipeptidase [Streptomyces sp. NPDC059629]|uniref:membrane dipeptidase n=1 Tax=Streptomyces sp. NPDC059629 TaxID=3346889 RepID=UPI0036A42A89